MSEVKQSSTESSGTHAPESHDASPEEEARAKQKAGQVALKKLLAPVQTTIYFAQFLALISSVLAVAPYVALVALGNALIDGNTDDVASIVKWLLAAFLGQLFFYFLALAITHFADAKLVGINRRRIITAIAKAPLSWFSQTNSGKVRKAVEDDTLTLHTLTAHAPVEQVAAIFTPLALLVYAFILDWRLGLLSIATVPIFLAIQAYSMKDMGTKLRKWTIILERFLPLQWSSPKVFPSSRLSAPLVKLTRGTAKLPKNSRNSITSGYVHFCVLAQFQNPWWRFPCSSLSM